jgi:hypothetical protein
MKKLGKVIAFALLAVVAILAIGWLFVVPGEIKTIVRFSRWHDSHVRASGYVEREPAGTRVYWEEFGKADGPPVVVLHAGLCTIAVMGGQIEPLAAESGARAPHQRRTRPRASAVRDRDQERDPRGATRDHPRRAARAAAGEPRRRKPNDAVVPQAGTALMTLAGSLRRPLVKQRGWLRVWAR